MIVATCTTPKTLPAAFRTSPKVLVNQGKSLSYRIRFRNTDPLNTLTGIKVEVRLPRRVHLVSAITFPYPVRGRKTSGSGTLSNGVVTWQNVTMAAKRYRDFRVRVRVATDVPSATPLSFGCTLYQTNASPNGDPYCPQQTQNATVSCVMLQGWCLFQSSRRLLRSYHCTIHLCSNTGHSLLITLSLACRQMPRVSARSRLLPSCHCFRRNCGLKTTMKKYILGINQKQIWMGRVASWPRR